MTEYQSLLPFLFRASKTAASSDVIVLSDEDSPTQSGSPISAPQEGGVANVCQIQQLLEQEESKLRRLKQLRGIQSPVTSAPSVEAAVPEHSRSSARGSTKTNIVVVPGNQSQKPATTVAAVTGISSRLQHIVDSIAVNEAFPPSHKTGTAGAVPPGSHLKQQTVGLINKSLVHLTHSTALQGKGAAGRDVITISDSPSLATKTPPPLLPTPAAAMPSSGKTAVQVSSVSSSSSDPGPPSLRPVDPEREKAVMAAVENSKRYKDYLSKHLLAKRSFQKQIEGKIAAAPYPKTFRQVWPVIPVFDTSFIRNYGLEAIMQHFDSSLNSSAAQDRANGSSKVKPICNQCGCDFASAWQIRKSNSKQLLLCEACDFANLKILQRSKLANQLRDLLASISKEREQFQAECEEARKQVVSVERQLVMAMMTQQHVLPPLFSSHAQKAPVGGQSVSCTSTLNSRNPQPSRGKLHSSTMLVNSSQAVIPSILPSLSSREMSEGSRKRKDAGGSAGGGPPGKSLKLDQTLDKLSKALLERKLDEQRQQAAAGRGKEGEGSGGTPDSRKSKRKGTPRHKRHLSSSSPNSP